MSQAPTRKPAVAPRRAAGRQPIAGETMLRCTYRLTPAQKAKVGRLGGATWLRGIIDAQEEK